MYESIRSGGILRGEKKGVYLGRTLTFSGQISVTVPKTRKDFERFWKCAR